MKKSTYFLFGKEATTIYLEDGIEPLIEAINDDNISYDVFEFIEGETSPVNLLMKYQEWGDYSIISKEEFNQL
ncbi:hypothetical protein [Belliella pelovolcani]|uniref:Uncharacterized protein n=1 Tax=Belliella pelovolcani TaxID=529505 RepID=A0A1N7MRM6_9BACT|nr:hypothetical protein [Belliella pelovolcani]SIS88783.1 hypothetical protein SAMN05421761_10775 [Belliella pelovolcani]